MADLHTEGIELMLEEFFQGATAPTQFYLGLATNTSLAENAALTDISEVTGTGYSRQLVERSAVGWPTSEASGTNDWRVITKEVTFTATGTWTTANTLFLATTNDNTGKLIASAEISPGRTLGNGDSLQATESIQING